MPNYVALLNWTDQGIKNVKDTPQRARAFREDAERRGIKVNGLFWTQGRYDIVALLEAPDESTMLASLLAVGSLGNVRSETLRAFTENEIGEALRKM
jgi:uncharacterized protein with GYD domain